MDANFCLNGKFNHPLAQAVIALLAGALSTLSFAPFGVWPAALVSLYLLIHLLQTDSSSKALLSGWLFGVGMFGTGSSWVYVSIHLHGYAPIPLALFLTAIWSMGLAVLPALFASCYIRFIATRRGAVLFGFPALWVLFEWLRSWLFTGFPWLYLGYGYIDTWLAGWAAVGGVYTMSLAVALSASALFVIAHRHNKRLKITAALILLSLWLGGLALNQIQWASPRNNSELKIGIVQANIPQHLKWLSTYYSTTLNVYQQMTESLEGRDIIIWPEAAIPNYYQNAQSFLRPIAKALGDQNTTLITGIPYRSSLGEETKFHNSIASLGNGSGLYHKRRLVPFGEYVPLENMLRGLIQFFDLPMSNFSPGPAQQGLLSAGDLQLAPFICYEIVYPDMVREFAQQADVLITISNDSWFGASIGPLQHLQMARMRALENGRYLIRSTNNGVSAIIDPKGNIQSESEQFVAQTLEGTVRLMNGNTLFSRTGSLPALLICALVLVLLTLNIILPMSRR